jgi:hypothetical protein
VADDNYLIKACCNAQGKMGFRLKVNFGYRATFLDVFHNIGIVGFENGMVSLVETDRFSILLTVELKCNGQRFKRPVNYAGLVM